MSTAEEEVREAQAKRLELQYQLDESMNELAAIMKKHLDHDATAVEIGSWLTSPDRPQGVTRQAVYKFISEHALNGSIKTTDRPKLKPKITQRPRPAKRA